MRHGVSIHAPARGATGKPADESAPAASFNPRAREGRDVLLLADSTVNKLFQSTRPRGARQTPGDMPSVAALFQSTRPRGARRDEHWIVRLIRKFQSTRPRGARRPRVPSPAPHAEVSIHAPARGATRTSRSPTCRRKFQSTRPRGARQRPSFKNFMRCLVSIHAPARGATRG